MIDFYLKFSSIAAAKSDPVVQQHYNAVQDAFRLDYVLPGIQAWRPSQDVTSGSPPVTTHTYLTGWFALIAWPTQVAILLNHTALQFALNRDGPPYVVKNNIAGIITDIAASPQFLGSHYPVGGLS